MKPERAMLKTTTRPWIPIEAESPVNGTIVPEAEAPGCCSIEVPAGVVAPAAPVAPAAGVVVAGPGVAGLVGVVVPVMVAVVHEVVVTG